MEPKEVVKQFWSDYEGGDLDAAWLKWVSPSLVIHPASGFEFTRETWLEAEKALVAAFSDVRTEVLDQVAEGNKVACRWTITGTQKAEFFGVPSAGKTATLSGTTFDLIEDDQVVEHWAEVGVPQFLQQLSA